MARMGRRTLHKKTNRAGWIVTICGAGINLCLGGLYSWSILKRALEGEYGLSPAAAALPYTVSCLVFAFMMVPAGRLQDRFGPRVVATLGGLMFGAGLVVAGLASPDRNTTPFLVGGFGILSGFGLAFGYASTTPPAVKWFPPQRQGLIVGLVVGGVGLASVYVAPLTTYLLNRPNLDVAGVFRILGICFCAVIVVFAQFLKNPPPGHAHPVKAKPPATSKNKAAARKPGTEINPKTGRDYAWAEMMRTPQFYLLWTMFLFGSGAGLMLISFAVSMAKGSIADIGFVLVAVLAVGNAGGRLAGGVVSDKIGRTRGMLLVFVAQACMLGLLSLFSNHPGAVLFCVAGIGFNYGACLSLFPSITADYYGLKNLGLNYGIMFTAWGCGSIMATVAGRIKEATGSYTPALALAAALCIVAAGMTFLVRVPAAAHPHKP
jgi:OFA family oxalate/formate antiporter-like MFS transporter